MRTSFLLLSAFAVLAAQAQAAPFVHVQTNKPTYRLGERIWFKAHVSGDKAPLTVELIGPQGKTETQTLKPKDLSGSFLVDAEAPGGTYVLRAVSDGATLHEVRFWIYDVAKPALDLSLTVLGEELYPGDTLSAAFQARDLKGNPVTDAKVRYRATFGDQVFAGWTGPTDREGRTVVRLGLPADLSSDGHLAVGVDAGKKRRAAISRPVPVTLPVARVDAFPEGGTVVPGYPTRMGLLARNTQGDPTRCEGRVVNDLGESVATFTTDGRGQAQVEVPCADERTYSVHIDRPLSDQPFALPADTGHPYSVQVRQNERSGTTVTVRARKAGGSVEVALVSQGAVERKSVFAKEISQVTFKKPGSAYAVARVLVIRDGRAYVNAPVLRGNAWPLQITTRLLNGPREPGGVVTCEVRTLLSGRPVSTDVAISAFNAGALFGGQHAVPSLAARHLLAPHLTGPTRDVADLFATPRPEPTAPKPAQPKPAAAVTPRPSATAIFQARRETFLWIRGAFAYPAQGQPLAANGLPAPEAGRRSLAPITPPVRDLDDAPKTQTRPTGLDELLARSIYTLDGPPRPRGSTTFRRNVPETAMLHPPGLGKKRGKLPQDQRVPLSRVDVRDALLWHPQLVTTDKAGKARVRFRLSHETSPLRIVAEGFSGDAAASGGTSATGAVERKHFQVNAEPLFGAQFEFPKHLRVGDRVELRVVLQVHDGRTDPVHLAVSASSCLRPLDRTEITLRPRSSGPTLSRPRPVSRRLKFRYDVVRSAERGRVRVVTSRGPFQEVADRSFTVGHADIEVSGGRSGYGDGTQSVTLKIPANAIPGSVRVHSRVSASSASEQSEGVESMLREPYGCFEQTTSSNYPNLLVLGNLLHESPDAALLERAYTLAHKGYERILSFQKPDGGFTLWQKGTQPESRYTAMAVAQLAEYGRLFHGKGQFPLRRALAWLKRHKAQGIHNVYAAVAASGDSEALARFEPKTNYELALLAERLTTWSGEWKPKSKTQAEVVFECVEKLEEAMDPETGVIVSEGHGVMGSSGQQLSIVTTSLAAVALDMAGRPQAARHCMNYLASQKHMRGGWGSTQSTILALRALSRVVPITPPETMTVEMLATGVSPMRSYLSATRNRPLLLSRRIGVEPGRSVNVRLRTSPSAEVNYGLGVTYRMKRVAPSQHAAYRIETSFPRTTTLSRPDSSLSLHLKLVGRRPAGQVVAQIGIPAGFTVSSPPSGVSSWEVKNGSLVLYWTSAPDSSSVSVPLEATSTGVFSTGPTVVYPYYAPEAIAYASSKTVSVFLEHAILNKPEGK